MYVFVIVILRLITNHFRGGVSCLGVAGLSLGSAARLAPGLAGSARQSPCPCSARPVVAALAVVVAVLALAAVVPAVAALAVVVVLVAADLGSAAVAVVALAVASSAWL